MMDAGCIMLVFGSHFRYPVRRKYQAEEAREQRVHCARTVVLGDQLR